MTVLTVLVSSVVQAQAVYPFDLPEQPLAESLRAVGHQTSTNVMFEPRLVRDLRAPALRKQTTAAEAIHALLEGTRLSAVRTAQDSILIQGARTDEVEKITAEVSEAAPMSLAQAESSGNSRNAQSLSSSEKSSNDTQGELVVTGSRLRRVANEGAAPVTVFDRERIEQLGVSNVGDLLNYLPQQSFSTDEQNNFGSAKYVQLRGLARGRTLVLINGRRTVTSALQGAANVFDLSTVPLAAVERVEILSDSASALYGADAIGGVMNIILKRDAGQPVVDLYYGGTEGGAEERRLSFTAGLSAGRFNGSFVLDAFDRDVLMGIERDRTANQDFRRFGDIDRRSRFGNPGNITSRTAANLPGLSSRIAAVPVGSTGIGLTPASFAATAGQTNLYSASQFSTLVPDTQRLSAAMFGDFDIARNTSAFGELLYSRNRNERFGAAAILPSQVVPSTNAFNPFGVDVLVDLVLRGPAIKPEDTRSETTRAVAGLRGDAAGFDWEVSGLFTHDVGAGQTFTDFSAVPLAQALASNDPQRALNVFQDGPGGSEALIASLLFSPVNHYASDARQLGAFASRKVFALPAGPVEMVLGAEYRTEEILFESIASVVRVDKDRRTTAVYSELRVPIVGAAMDLPLVQRLTASLAGRYDDYSDAGSTTNPQFGLEWVPYPAVLLRASYGTSFRSPSLYELYRPTSSRVFTLNDPRRNGQETSFSATTGGSVNLGPEESQSMTAGFLLTPDVAHELRIGASYWWIDQERRVVTPSVPLLLVNELSFPGRVTRAAQTLADIAANLPGRIIDVDSTTINAGRLRTSGVDMEVGASFETPIGRFSPSFLATWTRSQVAADFPSLPETERVGVANVAGTIPDWRASATVGWSRSIFGVSATARYVSAYDDVDGSTLQLNGRTVGAQTLIDLQATLDFGRDKNASGWLHGMAVRAGLTNALDEEPNFAAIGGRLGYDPSIGELRGRFGYVSISKSF